MSFAEIESGALSAPLFLVSQLWRRLTLPRAAEHVLKQVLEGHGVAAALAEEEELTIALEDTVVELYLMTVVIATERDAELLEAEAFALLGVALGLLNLADHAVIHGGQFHSAARAAHTWDGNKKARGVITRSVLGGSGYSAFPAATLGA